MIFEFALEPELVARWHNRKEYLFFEEKFGIKTGRMISKYPKKWRDLVWQAFTSSRYGRDQNAQSRLNALLDYLCQNSVKRRDSFFEKPTWLERTEAENAQRPFHGIVASINPRNNSRVIRVSKLIESGHEYWIVKDDPVIARNVQEVVAAVAPLLRVCQQAIFIDPYFKPTEQRFTEPFAGYMKQLWTCCYGLNEPVVELHTGIERFFDKYEERSTTVEERVADNLALEMKQRLPRFIPAGKKVKIFIWKQKPHGQKLHNRYLLTEVAGILFGTGLDVEEDPESIDQDDLRLLSPTQLEARWKHYKGNPPAFDAVRNPFEIIGRD